MRKILVGLVFVFSAQKVDLPIWIPIGGDCGWWVRVNFVLCDCVVVWAEVPKLGQRGEVQDLMAKVFVGSNPTLCTNIGPLAVLLHLKKLGRKESTLISIGRKLRHLAKQVDLNQPEKVKEFIANKNCSDGHKDNLIDAYSHYCQFYGLKWTKPKYVRVEKALVQKGYSEIVFPFPFFVCLSTSITEIEWFCLFLVALTV